MSLKTRAILVICIGTVMGLSLSIASGVLQQRATPDKEDLAWEQAQLFAEVMQRVKSDYVEPLDDAELMESAIRGMVQDLDAHSEFLDASEYRDIRASTSGSYTGIGIEVAEINGTVRVISPIAGSPAARSGIRSGDEIVAVDGQAIDQQRLRSTLSQLRGSAGSKVTLTVERDDEIIDHTMRRQIIRVASVHKEFLNPAYGYVRVSQFSDNTSGELADAVADLQSAFGAPLEGVVLDLRNNPGGVLDAAIDVSDLFLNDGVIVSADGRTSEARFSHSALNGDVLDGTPMVVLVNSGSASASEIVAGALQDHNRATIVGTATFGKGLVQTVMPLSKGRAIKLTTSRYYTPSGDSIHEVGISPDVVVDDTPGFPDLSLSGSLDREADAQLHEALALLQSRAVMQSLAQ